MRVIGVDEHRWSHTRNRRGDDGFVTVSIDLTPVLDGAGRARLLDLVAGRSAAALKTWLADQAPAFRDRVEVVAMDGFGGYQTAAAEQLPEATTVMDPFHVVALAGVKLDLHRQRVQQQTQGHRGRSGDPLDGVRRTLRTRLALLSSRQPARLSAVFADDDHLAVLVTWSVYQRIICRLQPARPAPRHDDDDRDYRLPAPRRTRRTRRTGPNWAAPCGAATPTYWPTSTTTPPTAPPKPSTAASKHYAETPLDSGI